MLSQQKPSFVFPYHDPHHKYNNLLKKNLDLLQTIFEDICVSATPLTVEKNASFLNFLESKGCHIHRNGKETVVGDHFRGALKKHIGLANRAEWIFVTHIDKLLFALETNHKQELIDNVTKKYDDDLIVFCRGKKTWSDYHPDYYKIEKMVTDMGEIFTGQYIDWIWPAVSIKNDLIEEILDKSQAKDFDCQAEFILIALNKGFQVSKVFPEWTTWEEPFWLENFKKQARPDEKRNTQMQDNLFRLDYCADTLKLFFNIFRKKYKY